MTDLSREIKPVFKLDFSAHGILESLSDFGTCLLVIVKFYVIYNLSNLVERKNTYAILHILLHKFKNSTFVILSC
jgi:hypothetical protein